MSTIDEDMVIVPWVGPKSCKNTLTVIVLSQNVEIIENIAKALTEVYNKGEFRWKLRVLQTVYLEEVERQSDVTGRIALDFVIVAIDTARMFSLEWTKNQVRQVHPDLRSRRVVLVNAGGLPKNAMALNVGELVTFQNDYKLEMLTGDVMKQDDAVFLARRLLKYMEVSKPMKNMNMNLSQSHDYSGLILTSVLTCKEKVKMFGVTSSLEAINNLNHQNQYKDIKWKIYKGWLCHWFKANNIDKTMDKARVRKRAILLSALENIYLLACYIALPEDLDTKNYESILQIFDNHFTPKCELSFTKVK